MKFDLNEFVEFVILLIVIISSLIMIVLLIIDIIAMASDTTIIDTFIELRCFSWVG